MSLFGSVNLNTTVAFLLLNGANQLEGNFSLSTKSFMYVQGTRVSLLLADKVIDSELMMLAANIPFRVIHARTPITSDKYSKAYN